jgi:hypothetical protein
MMEEGDSFSLLKVFLDAGEIARPMTEILIDNEPVLCEYDVLERFKNDIEAKNYAEANNVEIVYS